MNVEHRLLTEWGIQGVVAVAFLFLLRWMMTRFEVALTKITERQDHHATSLDVLTCAILSLQQQLLVHDLTVSGLNPAAGATVDERVRKALKRFEEVQNMLKELQRLVQSGAHYKRS
jgi:hypothetical protein